MGIQPKSLLFSVLAYIAVPALLASPPPQTKIVGGVPASPGEFPYQVSLRSRAFGHVCGGAILSPSLVITAGVCTYPNNPGNYQVMAGSLKRTEDVPWAQIRNVSRMVRHPDYNTTTIQDNDLGLVFLEEPLVFNENISSVALPTTLIETYPQPVILSGWGNVQYGEPLFEDLQKVTLTTYSDSDCEVWTGQHVPAEILCAGADEGGIGGCQGDAGTPLVTLGNNSYLAAVDSHFPCPRPDCCGTPGPNGQAPELSYYVDWILEQSRLYGGGL